MEAKLKSRKFIVWVVATVFLAVSFISYGVTKDSAMSDVVKIFSESWGWLSAVYIGGNVAQKYICKGGTE